ncbi:MAG TPA: TetR/AcrR family transcriptional regulator [Candidatus Acidoferrum sp.]|jgi:AcrR family transcriptional regulator|nr:TetR/AcrR family transcriptional regulator [Candidatus Acidoferrum sp.]
MSPRPRKVSDSQLFAATHAVMSRVGPRELTLAAIAKEAGVTAAVLVQRFGSKRALLLALSEKYSDRSGEFIAALAKRHASPLAALRAYADCMAGMAASPAALARNLAYLQIDMTDPDFRRHLVKQARATRAGLKRLVEAALKAGELMPRVKPMQLARTIETVLSGSLITWGFYREGTAANWMRADLEAVLAPWLTKRRRKTGKR